MDSIDRYDEGQLMINDADVMKKQSNIIVFITIFFSLILTFVTTKYLKRPQKHWNLKAMIL
jgi:hypothetical protein